MQKAFRNLNCHVVTSGDLELMITLDVGPRIISLSYNNSENLLYTFPDDFSCQGATDYHHYGGHRLWTTPESISYSYHPENIPVTVVDGWFLSEKDLRNIQKGFRVTAIPEGFLLEQRLTNLGNDVVESSPWGITMLKGGGFAIFPNEPQAVYDATSLLPARTLSIWSYTKLHDPRLIFGENYTTVKHSETGENFKIGAYVSNGWGACIVDSLVFHKTFSGARDVYPDYGANFEVFTCKELLEIETTGTMRKLQPGDNVTCKEVWQVFPLTEDFFEECNRRAALVKHLVI